MTVERIIFMVEEVSTEEFLVSLLSRYLAEDQFEIHAYNGKPDLVKKLENRLRGYAGWLPESWRIIVLVDRDSEDCATLKRRLEEIVARSGLRSKSHSERDWEVATRIAIEELEAWYIGDWPALCRAYPRVSPNADKRRRFRDPDAVAGGTWEALEQILQRAGYFKGGLEKIELARTMGASVIPWENRSKSFQRLWEVVCASFPSILAESPRKTA